MYILQVDTNLSFACCKNWVEVDTRVSEMMNKSIAFKHVGTLLCLAAGHACRNHPSVA